MIIRNLNPQGCRLLPKEPDLALEADIRVEAFRLTQAGVYRLI